VSRPPLSGTNPTVEEVEFGGLVGAARAGWDIRTKKKAEKTTNIPE